MVNESCCVYGDNGVVIFKVFFLFIMHFFKRKVIILCVVSLAIID